MKKIKNLIVKNKKLFLSFGLALLFLGLVPFSSYHFLSESKPSLSVFSSSIVRAAENQTGEGSLVSQKTSEYTVCDLYVVVVKIFNWLLGLSFAVAVLAVIVAGFIYISSAGNSNSIFLAKEGLKYSLIGFAICLLGWLSIQILFTIIGTNNQGDWWTIKCEDSVVNDEQATALANKAKVQKILADEVPFKSLGGRINPYLLSQVASKSISSLPQDKYFFIHGLGGQSAQESIQELAKMVFNAEENKKLVFAAVPEKDSSGNITGTELINLNEYLDSALNSEDIMQSFQQALEQENNNTDSSGTVKLDQVAEDQLMNLMLELLSDSASQEIPLIITPQGTTPPEFSGVWPEANWTDMTDDGSEPDFKPLSTSNSGLLFEEGSGPFFYDPERNDDQIPEDQTHLQINLNEDGSLDTKNPITVLNVSPGVTEEELSDYLDQTINVLLSMDRQTKSSGDPSAFASGLADILSRSVTEKLQTLDDQGKQSLVTGVLDEEIKANNKEESDPNTNDTNDNNDTRINHYEDYWNLNSNPNKPQNTIKNEVTGGSGILPSQIKKEDPSQQISNNQANNLIKSLLNDQNQGGNQDSSNSQNSGSGSDTGSSNNTGNSNINNNNWSSTSISISGYSLNQLEKGRLEKMIGEYLREMKLNLPPEFVMCIIRQESNFKPESLNNVGEYSVGLMQLNVGVGTARTALNALKKYAPDSYQKLLKQHDSDANIISTNTLLSRNDPAGEKGMTNIALGVAYLKLLNAQDRNQRGGNLQTDNDLDNLAAGYNCGPAGCKGGHTFYSTKVTGCTKTMVGKRESNDGQFKF